MNGYTSFNRIEDLKDWFLALPEFHYYTIYGEGKKRIESQSFADRSDGWESLSRRIMALTNNGGSITVYVGKTEKDSNGFTVLYTINQNSFVSNSIQGTPGVGAAEIATIVSKALEDHKKDLLIESLQNEVEEVKKDKRNKGLNAIFSDFGQTLEENPILVQVLGPFINGLAGKFFPKAQNVAMGNAPGGRRIIHQTDMDVHDQENDQEIQYNDEENHRISLAINRLANVFDDPIGIIEKISIYAENNPDKVKTLINFL